MRAGNPFPCSRPAMSESGHELRFGRTSTNSALVLTADMWMNAGLRATKAPQSRMTSREAVQKTLEKAGVEFIPENGGGAGVRMEKRKR